MNLNIDVIFNYLLGCWEIWFVNFFLLFSLIIVEIKISKIVFIFLLIAILLFSHLHLFFELFDNIFNFILLVVIVSWIVFALHKEIKTIFNGILSPSLYLFTNKGPLPAPDRNRLHEPQILTLIPTTFSERRV